ncbi:MAG: hypothetical protein PHF08_05525, partial [Candidatus Riflebacteria bacterium]|nr:hypothetical protein [Candidatus Riflebacteria bacterium]
MIRPRFWVFAFIILLFFMSCDVAHAIITMNVGFNLTDQNGNGIINVGDVLVVTANLTAQDGDNLNNVSEIKCRFNTAVSGAILEATLTGTAAQRSYTYNFTEDTNVNYQAINNVTVTATTLSPAIINQFTLIDLCPPQPASVLVTGLSNFNVDPINNSPIIRRDSTFRLSFTDSKGQTIPAAGTNGTSAFVNLGPIGGIAQLLLTRTGTAPNYSFTTGTLTASAFNEIENDNLTLTYTITDNVNPARTGAFQNFKFDNKPPKPVEDNTGFDTQKTMLTFGDNIILRAQVTQYGLGDFVNGVLTFTPTTGGTVTRTFNNMAIDGTPAQGGTVDWRETINVAADAAFNGKTGNLSVTYTFRDLAGNQATVTKTMPCDFRDRAYTTKIINADTGVELTGSINRQSRFYFDITYTSDYSPPAETIVSVDLAQIGLGNVTFNRTGKIFRTNAFTAAECSTLEAPNLMLPYSINEGINDPITGNFAPIRFDNKAPIPVDANTGFETTKPSLTFGDNISIIAQVNEYGVGDTVKAELTFGAYNRTFEAMNFNGPANAGATVNWREIINSQTDPNFANKAGNISVKFTFKDQAGNEVILNKTIACDFREPQYTARIINADTGLQTNLINRNTRFYYEIEYTGDYSPPADAVLTVDLTLIGRGIVNYIRNAPTGKVFRTTTISASECSMVENPDVIFVYTINDNINPAVQGNNPSVRFDNKPPMPVNANTGFETDKTTLVYGDNIDLIAQVTNYGAGDFASVTLVLTDTEDIVTSRTISNMSLDGDAAVGGTVTWRNSIDPSLDLAFKAKAGSLKGIFEFIDNAGNVATITKNILVNFKLPEFVRTDASVLLPDGSDSPYTVATTACLLQFEVELKEMPASGVTVTADLTPVAGPSDLELLHIGSNVFRGMYELPEGALDDVFNGPFVFVITAVDGNGQTVGEDTTPALAVDNVIPIISAVTITNTTLGKAANAPFLIGDTFAVSVEATRIESGKITVDLTAIDAALPAAELTLVTGNTYTYNGVVLNCKDAGVICDDSKQFTVRAYDTVRVGAANVPGHYITALTPSRKFDNEPPIVKTAGYSVKTAAGTVKDIFDPNVWVKVSDRVTLFVDVASTTAAAFDGQKVQLTNGGLYSLSTSNFNISGNKYVMEFTVPANDYNLSYNEYVASFTYRVTDNDGNTAVDESFVATDSIYVYNFDQYPPDLSKITFEVAPTSSRPGIIQKGDRVDFTVTIDGLTDVATISVDTLVLSTPTATPTLYLESTDGGITYTGSIDVVDGSQAEDYRFEAYIFDVAGNVSVKKDNTLYTIDCVAPEFVSHYFTIGKDNGDNPDGAVANIEDELWLVAEISDYADGAASATIYYDGVHIATSTFVYNSSMSMHVAKFVVKKPGIDKWPAMDGSPLASLTYDLTSLDIHGNTGVVVSGDSNNQADVSKNFVVRNVTPAIAFSGIALAPNNPVADKGGIPVYNLGDNLIASGTLSTDSLVSAAYLDLSALPGGPAKYYLTDINASSAASINPIDLVSEFGINVDYTQVNLHLNLIDKGGKIASAPHALIVDTKRPSLTKATFDGTNIVVNISEKITGFDNTANWRLIGSTTAGVEDYIDLSSTTYADAAVVNNATFSIHLAKEGRRKLSAWAHLPLYLAVPSAGFTDESGNAVDAVAYYPLNLIDTSWREPAKISSITLEKSFGPAYTDDNLVMTFTFNREMDFTSLVGKPVTSTASHTEIALFVNSALTDAQIKSAPSYSHFYVFQKDDVFTDASERMLQVTLCASGTYWVSRKLSDNTKNLMVAHRYTTENRRFVSDEFNRPIHYYGVSQKITVTDNRAAIPSLAREVTVVGEPLLDLTNRTLDIKFSEPVLLFKDEFTNNLADPYSLVLPATRNVPVTDYINKIKIYYDLDKNSFITPSFTGLAATNDLASTTLRLGLSVDDIRNILTMYANNSDLPNWGVRIEADAFNTVWKTGNNQYADFIEPVPGSAASVDISFTAEDPMVACAVSDAPPLKEDKGNLKFEFELVPNKVTGIDVVVPFDKNVTPKAAIFRMPSAGTYVHLASATFSAWGTRTVNGVARDVVSFTVNDNFAGAPFDTASGAIKLVGLRNILKFEYNEQVAEKVYNISDRNISSETGFTNASQPLIIDTLAPEALAFSHETSGIGLSPANAGRYSFTYSETMDPAFTPTFYLATGPSRLYFTFVEWSDDNTTAVFKNNTAITPMTLNGFWSYFLSGGKDLASNDAQDKTGTVEVRSQVASIKTINLYTKQKNIDATNYVVDKPFNYDSLTDAKAEVGITYLVA